MGFIKQLAGMDGPPASTPTETGGIHESPPVQTPKTNPLEAYLSNRFPLANALGSSMFGGDNDPLQTPNASISPSRSFIEKWY